MVDYPSYMQKVHEKLLVASVDGSGSGTGGVVAAIATAITADPYNGLTAFDPATYITAMETALTTFTASVTAMNAHTDFDTYHSAAAAQIDAVISPDSYITARAAAHAVTLDNEINTKVLPRFNAGMRDINAVQTSAFVIGNAIIMIDRNDKVDKFIADMRFQADSKRAELVQNATAEMIRMYLQKLEYGRVEAALTLDEKRLAFAMQGDYKTETKALAADDARWPLETYKYGANMLAAVGGGVTSSTPTDGNKTARIIGSGLSGAVAGAMVGREIGGSSGGGIGAIMGGIAGLLGGA
jgi:hypothetical protein